MNGKLAMRRLIWKECRQLLPLILMLLLIGAALLLVVAWNAANYIDTIFVLPILCAAGTAAVLIGQEKELRTLEWLQTIPVRPERVVMAKLAVGLAGLAVVWLGTYNLWWLGKQLVDPSIPSFGGSFRVWDGTGYLPEFSVYLMLAGFWMAGRLRFSLVVLLLMIPAACLPGLVASAISGLVLLAPDGSDVISDISLGSFMLLAFVLAWRAGVSCLSAQSTSRIFPGSRGDEQSVVVLAAPTPSPAGALLWQFLRQNWWPLWGLGLLWAIGLGLLASTIYAQEEHPWNAPALLAALAVTLSSSWLGTLVFASDRTHHRIQFLADRGVSAALTWWTRHGIPVALLAGMGTVVAVLAICAVLTWSSSWEQLGSFPVYSSVPVFSMTMLLLTLTSGALAYAASQWLAQVVLSPIISAICGPVFSSVAIGFFWFLAFGIGSPVWLLALVGTIPLLTTYALTRRWMEGRWDGTFWAGHTAGLLACCLLPLVPLCVALQRPSMSAETARALAEGARWQNDGSPRLGRPARLVMNWGTPKTHVDMATAQTHDVVFDDPLAEVSNLAQQLEESSEPFSADWRTSQFLTSQATLEQWRIQHDPQHADREQFRRTLQVLLHYTQRLRMSDQIVDQDMADQHEIWLLQLLRQPDVEPQLGEPLRQEIVRMLSDAKGRWQARRRALAISWTSFRPHESTLLGGYDTAGMGLPVAMIQRVLQAKRLSQSIADLWTIANDGPVAATAERRARLAAAWNVPLSSYGLGPIGRYLRADDLASYLPEFKRRAPATQWGAAWEDEAQRLANDDKE